VAANLNSNSTALDGGLLLTCKVAFRRSHGTRAPCTPGRPSPPARCRTARMRFVPERPPRPPWKLKGKGKHNY